jgi:hypothetical protein
MHAALPPPAVDPNLQGYYRRGDANFALGKFKEAIKDLRTVRGDGLRVNWQSKRGLRRQALLLPLQRQLRSRSKLVDIALQSKPFCRQMQARRLSAPAARQHHARSTTARRLRRAPSLASPLAAQAARRAPRDPDLRRKLSECEKAVKRIKFEEALATPVGWRQRSRRRCRAGRCAGAVMGGGAGCTPRRGACAAGSIKIEGADRRGAWRLKGSREDGCELGSGAYHERAAGGGKSGRPPG